MFIECQTQFDKAILYNVNNIVFVGDMKDKVSLLFDDGTFYQLPDEYNSIVKKIIEDHGGYIWATSKEGEGLTIFISLEKTVGESNEENTDN